MSSEVRKKSYFNKNVWVKSVITSSAAVLIMMNSTTASANEDKSLYHVFINDKKEDSTGSLNNNDLIQRVIEEKKEELEERLGSDNSLTLEGQVSYVPEFVLRSGPNDVGAVEWIKENVMVIANATKIKVDGEVAGYVEDEKAAQEIMEQIKLKYVTVEELDGFQRLQHEKLTKKNVSDSNNNKDLQQPVAEDQKLMLRDIDLKVGESKIYDLYVEQDVEVDSGRVVPEKVLSVGKAVKMLENGDLKQKKHIVKDGEFLGKIAEMYDLSSEQLLAVNPGLTEESIINIGDELNVQASEPLVNVVVKEVAYQAEEIPFKTEVIESGDLYKGETQIKQSGQNGEKTVLYNIVKENGKTVKKEKLEEKVVREPQSKIIVKGTKVKSSKGTGSFAWPTVGGYISSHMGPRWGRFHKGTDIARPSNRSILAVDNGVVEYAGWDDGGYGNKVIINHKNGLKTLYAHLSSVDVSVGQRVQRGSKIGVMGTTGQSTGVHLHLEVRKNGKLVNPMDFY